MNCVNAEVNTDVNTEGMIHNPVLKGFNPDPCLCRKGDDVYIAVSSFEWFPGIPIYHSRDMKHWELYSHALTNAEDPCLRGLPSAKGIWAPCLTYCESDDLFYMVYGVMNSMNARYFDVDNFVITARDLRGPWSKPHYIHSSGFDASMFHDDDGKKYVVALEWETRDGHEKPGAICIVEWDAAAHTIVGMPKAFWRGGTDRGCIEAPHLTKHGGYYYIMCAEGGTGYYHSVTMGRSRNVWGPYEADPANPIVTANPAAANERADWDHLKPRYFNPENALQKCGHGSYVELSNGEVWLAHLCSRPFVPELRCTLGRESALQRMEWTADGWLHMADGSNLAKEYVKHSDLPDAPLPLPSERDDFDATSLRLGWYSPRIDSASFVDLKARPGWARLRGQESLCSLNKVSLIAQKLVSVNWTAATRLDFKSLNYHQSAGLVLYYDNMNYFYLCKTFSDEIDSEEICIIELDNGTKREWRNSGARQSCATENPTDAERTRAPAGDVWMKVEVHERETRFLWSPDGDVWNSIGPVFDTTHLSDEYSKYGEFTGTFVGIACVDTMTHSAVCDADFFEVVQKREG